MYIPAVDAQGNGVVGKLVTVVRPGTGRIFFDVASVLGQPDTQESGRMAAQVAAEYAGVSLDSYDIFYTIEVNASVIEGPSAGGAMAVAVVLGIENRTANPRVAMTGAIGDDGSILPVGAVREKALAAKDVGIMTFLVPPNLSTALRTTKQRECTEQRVNGYVIRKCDVTYTPDEIDLGDELGMRIVEAATLADAVAEFTRVDV